MIKNTKSSSIPTVMLFFALAMGVLSCKRGNMYPVNSGNEKDSTTLYFENLKQYKQSKHMKAVGYFNGVTRVANPEYYNLRDVLDSVDIVNIFHRFNGLANLKRGQRMPGATGEDARTLTEIVDDVKYLQEKGTKVVETQFLNEIFDHVKNPTTGEKWKNNLSDYEGYAKAVSDSLRNWGFDGIDLDLEPGFSTGGFTNAQWEQYVNAFAHYFGPSSGTGKLLIIDTNVGLSELRFSKETLAKIDLMYIQDYFGSESATDNKIDGYIAAGFPKENMILISADFEASYESTIAGVGMPRLQKYYTNAKYTAKAGGFGAYGMNYDKKQNYKYYREMIHTLNPSQVSR